MARSARSVRTADEVLEEAARMAARPALTPRVDRFVLLVGEGAAPPSALGPSVREQREIVVSVSRRVRRRQGG
ncbi:hypothetical protein [Streptomyces zingiberis]|uniref:Uncharacterized protein n=1 Tax=Streptomyces zingiberis TaxID=2053010 RepID=A0ABX1BR48_9ACTN|nr:hypothetical protein [Streptomyces zingiberis]NJQ00210.1 hypothetical protein [Streptomyces zingiberis]